MRKTKEEIKTERELKIALSEEERYMGSVFVTPMGQRKHEETVKKAYDNYHRAGGKLVLNLDNDKVRVCNVCKRQEVKPCTD